MAKYKHDPIGAGLGGISLAILAFLLYTLVPITKEAFVTVFTGVVFLSLVVGAIAMFVVAIIVLVQTSKEKKMETNKKDV